MLDKDNIRILVVDDENDIRRIIRLILEKKGYSVIEAGNGAAALDIVRESEVDLVLMDIMMPKMSGIDATASIREFSSVPILFLTAKSLERDKESAYSSGGDDYLVKPFSSAELVMKVESLLRRYIVYKGKTAESRTLALSCGVEVDTEAKTVSKNGEEIILREKEHDIFFFLLENRGQTIDPNDIFEAVWQERALSSSANNVMVNMLGLRKKLEDDPSNPKIIKTVWGKGYQLV
ncbi:MAG: response regulator transcription factor [Clostridia bacterium]|nr:response regulator transcription factor [Clostridia bacterium]